MQIITNQGEEYRAFCEANDLKMTLDQFVLAHIPNQNPSDEIDRDRGMPKESEIVYQTDVTRVGLLGKKGISYSLFLDSSIGDFVFNTIYLIAKSDQGEIAHTIVTTPNTQKIKDKPEDGIVGDNITRNIAVEIDGASQLTGIVVDAESWQWDFDQATTQILGLNKIATDSEAAKGIDEIKTINPKQLRDETPIGSVQSYLGKKLPFGWIWFAKASFDEKIFSELFDVLGTNQLPSAENRVFRGASAEMPLGTIEEDAVKSHEIDVVINDANLGTKTSSEFGHKHQTVVDEGYDGSTQAHSPSSTEPMKRAHDTNGGGSYWLSHAKEKPSTTTPTISPTNKVNQNADTNIGTHGHTATASYKGASETRVKSLRINRIIRAIPSDNKIKLKYSQTFISYFDEKDKFFIATREYTKITAIVGGKEKLAVSLPPFATEILYTQSDAGKTGVYDEKTKTWNEIKDKRKTDYFNEFGEKFNLKSPLDDFPAWAIFQEPPKTDQHKLLKYNKPLSMWEAFDDVYQRDYFEEFGQKRIVTNKYFRLKPNETFQAPPKVEAGKAVQLVAKKWQIIDDNRDKCAFAKDNKKDSDYIIQTLDPIPNSHTLEERPSDWHTWDYLKNIWSLSAKNKAKKIARENKEKLAKEQSQNLIERLQSLEQELKTIKSSVVKV